MDYLNTIQCQKEPFAATTGEDLFLSQPLLDAIEKISHSIRLGAGLHIVTGEEASGKTTLLRQLSDKFSSDQKNIIITINNPRFSNLQQFLTTLAGAVKTIKPPSGMDDKKLQQAFNNFFHTQILQDKKTVLLLIDNGHLLPGFCLHALDELYGHHADCRRLLQTVICGEASLQKKIKSIASLNSRVVFTERLKPFGFSETKEFIRFHLQRAAADPDAPLPLFSGPAKWAVYRLTKGDPQQIAALCHYIALTLAIENRKKADWFLTLRCAKKLLPKRAKRLQLIRAGTVSSLIVLMLVFGLWSEQLRTFTTPLGPQRARPPVAEKMVPPEPQQKEEAQTAQETVSPEITEEAGGPAESSLLEETRPMPMVEEQIAAVIPPSEEPPAAEAEIVVAEPPPLQESAPPQPSEEKQIIPEVPAEKTAAVIEKPATIEARIESIATTPTPELLPQPEITPIVEPAIKERRPVKPGDTFLVMIQQVYGPGHLKPHFIDQVIAANPQLKNPDNLELGDEVFFPVLTPAPAESVPPARKTESMVAKKLDRSLQPAATPGLIGKLVVQPGDTLGSLIRGIYGPFSFNPEYTARVLAANKHVKNPDRLEVGETIYFPDLPVAPEVGLPAKPSMVAGREEIPVFLGDIIAIEEETFGDMVRRIYGPYSFNAENTKKILAVNPDLKNPNLLSVGQKIRFPTILITLNHDAADLWWVKIITLDNLQSAYRFLRVYSQWTPPMLIIPSANERGQVLFNIVLQHNYGDERSARAAINALPAAITADAKTIKGLDPSTFYYWTKPKDKKNEDA